MPAKKVHNEPGTQKGSEPVSSNLDSTPKRKRRTADEILGSAPESENKVPLPRPRRTPKPKAPPKPASATKAVPTTDGTPKATPRPEKATKARPPKAVTAKPAAESAGRSAPPVVTDEASIFSLSWRPAGAEPEERTVPVEPAVTPEAPAKPKKRTTKPFVVNDPEGRLVVLEFRTPQPGTKPAPKESVPDGLAPRKSRQPRREGREAATVAPTVEEQSEVRVERRPKSSKVAEAATPQAAAVAPPAPKRVSVVPQEMAAQVAAWKGKPTLMRNKRVIAPLFFSLPVRGRLEGAVLDEVRLAAESGVEVFRFPFALKVCESVEPQVEQAADSIAAVASECAGAQVLIQVSFVPPDDWKARYPESVDPSAQSPTSPSLADDEFWEAAAVALSRFVSALRSGRSDEHFLGIHLDHNDWSIQEADGHDTSVAAEKQFRTWLRHRYRDDAFSLRASWYDGSASFESVKVPAYDNSASGFVRTDRRSRPWIDYNLFASDMIVERIADLCYSAKSATEGDLVIGVNYGYLFEWSHPHSGHLSLGKLLRCPDLDYVSGPPSYSSREPGGAAAFPFPVDSITLNGKLFVSEEDFRTPIAGRADAGEAIPLMKTPQSLESAHWRGAGAALAHCGGVCWHDTFGLGWLNSRGIWDRAKAIKDVFVRGLTVNRADPDVAVFIDERSLAYLTDPRAFEAIVHQVRESMLRSGLSVGFYLLSDLAHRENFPECRLHVFVNAWDLRPEVKSAVKSRLQRDGKVLFWMYAAGLFEAGRESLERVREVTGIALRPQPFNSKSGTTILNTRDELCRQLPEADLAKGGHLEPSYFAIPEEAAILGEYTQTGLPSFVVRRFEGEKSGDDWTSVFLGDPIVTPEFFRVLAHMSGAHVWSYENDLIHAAAPFVTLHCAGTANRTIALPSNSAVYSLEAGEYLPVENNTVKILGVDGTTYSMVIAPIGEVQSILNADMASLVQIKEPILRNENTLHWESIKFDTSIMKLDEWIEEVWTDELADDLLLKPSLLETDFEAEPEETGMRDDRSTGRRRRRRRKGGRDMVGSEESASYRREGADRQAAASDDIGAFFRKRD